jgi:archaellin
MKVKLLATVMFALAPVLISSNIVFAKSLSKNGSAYVSGSVGNDLSWPNCNTKYTVNGKFGIVGVTDGLGYSTNPCLTTEASLFSSLSLYVNTGWDSSSSHINATNPKTCVTGDENCLAYNYGYDAGLYAYNAAATVNVKSSTWWLDVETANTWSTNVVQNQDSLQGEYDALKASGVTNVGVYSTTAQWDAITGTWKNNWPNWGATTWKTPRQAATYCSGHQFTGGPTWLIQFKGSIDQDYAC